MISDTFTVLKFYCDLTPTNVTSETMKEVKTASWAHQTVGSLIIHIHERHYRHTLTVPGRGVEGDQIHFHVVKL